MTDLDLIKNIKLDSGYNHTMSFVSRETQKTYFDSLVDISLEDFSVVRQDQEVKVQYGCNDLFGVNYCRYKNTINGVSKTFFAFIKDKKYINPNTTALILEVDVLQTYMFDYTIEDSFIEREHQDRFKVVGGNLIPIFNTVEEGINYGTDYIKNKDITIKDKRLPSDTFFNKMFWVYMLTTEKVHTSLDNNQVGALDEISPFYVYVFPYFPNNPARSLRYKNESDVYVSVGNARSAVVNEVFKTPTVISVGVLPYLPIDYELEYNGSLSPDSWFIKPNTMLDVVNTSGLSWLLLKFNNNPSVNTYDSILQEINKSTWLDYGFSLSINTPKNINNETKLFTNPYNYSFLTDNKSEGLLLKNEYIPDNIKIKFKTALSPTLKYKYGVDNYKNDTDYFSQINNQISELPLTSDAYLTYLSNNKASATSGLAINTALGIGVTAIGMGMGEIGQFTAINTGANLLSGVVNSMIKNSDIKQSPDTVRKLGNNPNFDIENELVLFKLYNFTISEEYKTKLFNYFYTYGYKSLSFKKPDIKSRYYFNYIKTIGVNISGNIDNDVINKIKSIFDNGVTIWHYRSNITFKGVYNYTYENVETSLIGD